MIHYPIPPRPGKHNLNVIDKIAFLVHEPTMYAHYASVWAEMPGSSFSIVLLRRRLFEGPDAVRGADDFMARITAAGYDYCYYEDLLKEGLKFMWVVSNHKIGGSTKSRAGLGLRVRAAVRNGAKRLLNVPRVLSGSARKYELSVGDAVQYPPLQIGCYQVRFMYGADIGDGWSLQDWNDIYDLFLCHGPNDVKQLGLKFKGKTALMGYPRYDAYFDDELDTRGVIEEFGLDPQKKTLLWMSTTGEGVSSIPDYARAISGLFDEYNVIARPHPIAFRTEPKNIDLLRSLDFNIDGNATRDMNRLYKVVDWVMCDYGGSSFGAIYLDINLLLLDVAGAESQSIVVNTSNIEIREHFPIIGQADESVIRSLLRDAAVWETQKAVRAEICDRYFADFKGTSSRRAAEILLNLDEENHAETSR